MPSRFGPWIFKPRGVLIPVNSISSRFRPAWSKCWTTRETGVSRPNPALQRFFALVRSWTMKFIVASVSEFIWFGNSSLSLFTTRECCRRKAAFEHAIGANKLRRLLSAPLAYPPVSVAQEKGEAICRMEVWQFNGVNEDRKCGVSDGVKPEQMAAKYTAASFLELRTI